MVFLGAVVAGFLVYQVGGDTDTAWAVIVGCLVVAAIAAPRWFVKAATGRGFWYAVLGLVLFIGAAASGIFTTGYDDAKRANNWHYIVTGKAVTGVEATKAVGVSHGHRAGAPTRQEEGYTKGGL